MSCPHPDLPPTLTLSLSLSLHTLPAVCLNKIDLGGVEERIPKLSADIRAAALVPFEATRGGQLDVPCREPDAIVPLSAFAALNLPELEMALRDALGVVGDGVDEWGEDFDLANLVEDGLVSEGWGSDEDVDLNDNDW
jgi:hypothetical protein